MMRVREPAGRALAGLIGVGIGHSLTPAMQEREAQHHGLRLHYQLIDFGARGIDASALPTILDAIRWFGFRGVNVTYPFKQSVVPLLDELAEDARQIDAVNTIVVRDGRLVGYNTDCSGWRWGFERTLPGADLSRVVLIGAGGAGSAIAHALVRMGVGLLQVHDRMQARARDLADTLARLHPSLRVATVDDPGNALREATGLVHASQTGMTGSPGLPVDRHWLHAGLWVAEAIYSPLETELLEAARQAGCATVDGGTMAVGQAIGAFELFTGIQPDPERMRAHFLRLLDSRAALP